MANFPTTPKPSNITIGSHYQNVEQRTLSFNRQVASRGGHRWSFRLSYAPEVQENFADLFSFLHGLKGRYGVCNFTLPNYETRSSITFQSGFTEIGIDQNVSNGQTVRLTGLNNGTTLKKGDFFKFDNHAKTYMISSDVNVTETNPEFTEINFCPALVRQVTTDDKVSLGATFQVAQRSDDLIVNYPSDQTFSTQVELMEVVASGGQSIY